MDASEWLLYIIPAVLVGLVVSLFVAYDDKITEWIPDVYRRAFTVGIICAAVTYILCFLILQTLKRRAQIFPSGDPLSFW